MHRHTVDDTNLRRHLMTLMSIPVVLIGCLPKAAHTQQAASADTDAGLRHRFRDVRGGEKYIDATRRLVNVDLYLNGNPELVFASGVFGPSPKISSYGGGVPGDQLVVPKTLQYVRWSDDAKSRGHNSYPPFEGTPLIDVTVPVASRIPDNVLDRVRQSKGGLRLKLRLHPQTLLVAWEVSLGQGWKFRRDFAGNAITTDEDTLPGGDFREARVRFELLRTGGERKIFEKGWYIDPSTGQKIETDF